MFTILRKVFQKYSFKKEALAPREDNRTGTLLTSKPRKYPLEYIGCSNETRSPCRAANPVASSKSMVLWQFSRSASRDSSTNRTRGREEGILVWRWI